MRAVVEVVVVVVVVVLVVQVQEQVLVLVVGGWWLVVGGGGDGGGEGGGYGGGAGGGDGGGGGISTSTPRAGALRLNFNSDFYSYSPQNLILIIKAPIIHPISPAQNPSIIQRRRRPCTSIHATGVTGARPWHAFRGTFIRLSGLGLRAWAFGFRVWFRDKDSAAKEGWQDVSSAAVVITVTLNPKATCDSATDYVHGSYALNPLDKGTRGPSNIKAKTVP